MSLDLELCKVDEDLLEVGAGDLVVFDDSLGQHLSELLEDIAEKHVAALDVDTLDTIADLDVSGLSSTDICSGRLVDDAILSTVMNKLRSWHQLSNSCLDAGVWSVVQGLLLPDLNRVTVAVLSLKVVGGAKDDETTIDHDGKLVAKLLCFVHTMGCENDRCLLHLLDHAVERAARDGVDATSRLIQEQHSGSEHQSLGAAKLTLVATTKVL